MCGIAGVIDPGRSCKADTTAAMVAALSHRGPDDSGIQSITASGSNVWLGNTRLSILDVSSAGHQPMYDHETGNWIVYNGELYNFCDLRNELRSSGCNFVSETDTEVVLKAYGRLGQSCVHRFRGMYAFAVWDAKKQEVFLCRDRVGEKPLYYFSSASSQFLFASEVRAILASNIPERRLDPTGMKVFLANGFLVSPHTLVAGVQGLLPGHCMRISAAGQITQIFQYWRPASPGAQAGRCPDIEDVREELREAVRLRLRSDVPLGAFLSGGMDSSTVVALMKEGGGEARTFSLTFEEKEFDESQYSRWVANRFQTRHLEIKMSRNDFYQIFPAAMAAMDQPTFDGVNTYCVARAARDAGLKVALSGTGSDELFGGYELFRRVPIISRIKPLLGLMPNCTARYLKKKSSHDAFFGVSGLTKLMAMSEGENHNWDRSRLLIAAYQTSQTLFPSWSRDVLQVSEDISVKDDVWFGLPDAYLRFVSREVDGEDTNNAISKLALRTFLGERCLRDIDFMSMGVSLEVRVPFLDHVLIDKLYGYIGSIRCKGAPDKPFLQEIVKPVLGDDYPWRKKKGFILPFQMWLHDLFDWESTRDLLNDTSLCEGLGFRPDIISLLFSRFREGGSIPWSRVWAIFVLLSWCRKHRISR